MCVCFFSMYIFDIKRVTKKTCDKRNADSIVCTPFVPTSGSQVQNTVGLINIR